MNSENLDETNYRSQLKQRIYIEINKVYLSFVKQEGVLMSTDLFPAVLEEMYVDALTTMIVKIKDPKDLKRVYDYHYYNRKKYLNHTLMRKLKKERDEQFILEFTEIFAKQEEPNDEL